MSSSTYAEMTLNQELRCQVCGQGGLERLLDLGYQPLCNEFLPSNQPAGPHTFYPLCLFYCTPCSLVQLGHVIPTKDTFGEQYTYLTGSSPSLVEYYSRLASRLVDRFDLQPGEVVIDIGSNDGTFLNAFRSLGMQVLGIEGSKQPAALAQANGIPTLDRFFQRGISGTINQHLPEGGKIRLIVAMNVLAHTDNINRFLPEVVELMDTDTMFVSSSHWLLELVRKFEFDTIYHEHLRYYTLKSLMHLFERNGLNMVDAEITDFYGGSILGYAARGSGPQSDGMASILQEEAQIDIPQSLKDMNRVLLSNKARLLSLLVELKDAGKRVVGIGAPMKASTLLNFYGITPDLVEYLAEVNQLKIGTAVPGVRIPVVHEDVMFQDPPDYALLLSWNMADHIIPKCRAMGYSGKFIVPVPKPKVLE